MVRQGTSQSDGKNERTVWVDKDEVGKRLCEVAARWQEPKAFDRPGVLMQREETGGMGREGNKIG